MMHTKFEKHDFFCDSPDTQTTQQEVKEIDHQKGSSIRQ